MKEGFLPTCQRSYEDFWLPMLNYNTPAYNTKTREMPWEREPSIFFSALPSSADDDTPVSPVSSLSSSHEMDDEKEDDNTAMADDTEEMDESTEGTPKNEDTVVDVQGEPNAKTEEAEGVGADAGAEIAAEGETKPEASSEDEDEELQVRVEEEAGEAAPARGPAAHPA